MLNFIYHGMNSTDLLMHFQYHIYLSLKTVSRQLSFYMKIFEIMQEDLS